MRPAFSQEEAIEVKAPVAGLIDTPQRALLPNEGATLSVNFHHDDLSLHRRHGRFQIGPQFITHFQSHAIYQYRKRDGTDELLEVRDEFLYRYTVATNVWAGAVTGINPAEPGDVIGNDLGLGYFVQHADRLYWWDGGTILRYYENTGTPRIRDWGFQGGALPQGLDQGVRAGGDMSEKEYSYVYTYFNPTSGHETNPSPESPTFTIAGPTNLSRNIRIPANASWDSDYSTVRISRSIGDGTGADFFFEKELTGITNLDTTFQDTFLSVADSELQGVVEFDNDPPPKLLNAILFNEQVVGVDADDKSSIVFSKGGNPQSWPPVNKKYLERDAGDDNNGLFVLLGRLFCVKRNAGVFLLLPAAGGSFTREKVTGDIGNVSHFSIVVLGTHAYWVEPRGVMRFDGQNVENISDKKIRQTFKRFASEATVFETYGVADSRPDKQYIRWLMRDSTENITYHVVYDVSRDAWFLERPGPVTPTPAAGSLDHCATVNQDLTTGERWVYTADVNGRTFRLGSNLAGATVWSDNNEVYASEWRSPWYGDGRQAVLPISIEFEMDAATLGKKAQDLVLRFYRDGVLTSPKEQAFPLFDTVDTPEGSRAFKMNLDRRTCRRFAVSYFISGVDCDPKVLNFRVNYHQRSSRVRGL